MAETKKKSGKERVQNKEEIGSTFVSVEKEADASTARMGQESINKAEVGGKIDMSLVRIKTEPNLITDCDTAPATVHFMHQEVNSFETMLAAIKEEIDSDTDISNNNDVTVHLLIPETILTEKTEVDIQASIEENLLVNHSSIDSDMPSAPSVLFEMREKSFLPNVNSENTSVQTVPVKSMKRQPRKRRNDSEFLYLESLEPHSSTTELNEIILEPKKIRGGRKKGSSNKKRNDTTPHEVSELDTIDLERPAQQSSTMELSKIVIESQHPKKRGRKKGSTNKNKKVTTRSREMVICPFCDRKMVKNYFPFHARVHTDEKPFKCQKCPYMSHFKGPLDFHMESHHPTEGYVITQG